LESRLSTSYEERSELKKRVAELRRENRIILTNASTLLETARQEIGKKNYMLTHLQKR
jgi:hypothetical protein